MECIVVIRLNNSTENLGLRDVNVGDRVTYTVSGQERVARVTQIFEHRNLPSLPPTAIAYPEED